MWISVQPATTQKMLEKSSGAAPHFPVCMSHPFVLDKLEYEPLLKNCRTYFKKCSIRVGLKNRNSSSSTSGKIISNSVWILPPLFFQVECLVWNAHCVKKGLVSYWTKNGRLSFESRRRERETENFYWVDISDNFCLSWKKKKSADYEDNFLYQISFFKSF